MGNKFKHIGLIATTIQVLGVLGILLFLFRMVSQTGPIFSDVLDELEIEQVQEFPDGATVYLKTDSIKGSVGSFFLGIYTINYVDGVGVLHTTTVKASSIHPTREVGGPVVPVQSDGSVIEETLDTTETYVEPYEVW